MTQLRGLSTLTSHPSLENSRIDSLLFPSQMICKKAPSFGSSSPSC
jgi:hypothetical protein